MVNYIIAEISGKQFKITSNKPVEVDYLGDVKKIECDKVLLKCEDGKVELGTPYLKDKIVLEVLDEVVKKKIRVATYKAKANTRRVKGQKVLRNKIRLAA